MGEPLSKPISRYESKRRLVNIRRECNKSFSRSFPQVSFYIAALRELKRINTNPKWIMEGQDNV